MKSSELELCWLCVRHTNKTLPSSRWWCRLRRQQRRPPRDPGGGAFCYIDIARACTTRKRMHVRMYVHRHSRTYCIMFMYVYILRTHAHTCTLLQLVWTSRHRGTHPYRHHTVMEPPTPPTLRRPWSSCCRRRYMHNLHLDTMSAMCGRSTTRSPMRDRCRRRRRRMCFVLLRTRQTRSRVRWRISF